jgi:hypothetical protein
MKKLIQMLLAIASLLLPVETVLSSTESPRFVNVSIEIHGLEESAKTLNQASLELAKKLTEMNPDAEKMSPEQLQQLALVIEQANLLVAAVNNAVDMTGPALESLKEPTRALVSEAMTSAYESSVDPAIQSVDAAVTRWIIFGVIGLLLTVAVIGFYFYFATRQLRAGLDILKSISEGYEIVPKKPAEEIRENAQQ